MPCPWSAQSGLPLGRVTQFMPSRFPLMTPALGNSCLFFANGPYLQIVILPSV